MISLLEYRFNKKKNYTLLNFVPFHLSHSVDDLAETQMKRFPRKYELIYYNIT